ncbi:16S rRNA (cytosine(1402)-N(4))-methyltransferase RsmH [Pararhodospirillum oryzae]
MRAEIVAALAVREGGAYVDGTFGAGGYSQAILSAAPCRVWAIDRDPGAIPRARALGARWDDRLALLPGCFGAMDTLLAERGIGLVDGVVLDIGVSSMQIDQPDRGFSFRLDGPLDMRMGDQGPTAADLVNTLDESTLADILFFLGEERAARRVARAVVERRAEAPFTRTAELASVIRSVVRKSADGIDPATRSFQALRIAVNDELGELARGLRAAERVLAPGGRLVVVSFHSLEDRLVKTFLRQRAGHAQGFSRHLPPTAPGQEAEPTFTLVERRALAPSAEEARRNPRARSARLRVAERTHRPCPPSSPPAAAKGVPGSLDALFAASLLSARPGESR